MLTNGLISFKNLKNNMMSPIPCSSHIIKFLEGVFNVNLGRLVLNIIESKFLYNQRDE